MIFTSCSFTPATYFRRASICALRVRSRYSSSARRSIHSLNGIFSFTTSRYGVGGAGLSGSGTTSLSTRAAFFFPVGDFYSDRSGERTGERSTAGGMSVPLHGLF